jgi:hypothetical protein
LKLCTTGLGVFSQTNEYDFFSGSASTVEGKKWSPSFNLELQIIKVNFYEAGVTIAWFTAFSV